MKDTKANGEKTVSRVLVPFFGPASAMCTKGNGIMIKYALFPSPHILVMIHSFLLTEEQRNGWGVYRFESEEVSSEFEFEGSWKDDHPASYPSQGTLRSKKFTYVGNIIGQPIHNLKECPHSPYVILQASIYTLRFHVIWPLKILMGLFLHQHGVGSINYTSGDRYMGHWNKGKVP